MLFDFSNCRVFLYSESIDMRCGMERLGYFVREKLQKDLLSGNLFLFLGKNRKRAKVLYFDHTGVVLITKRLETGRLMQTEDLNEVTELSVQELSLLLSGAFLYFSKSKSPSEKKEEILHS